MAQRNVTHNHSIDFQTSSGKQQWSHSTRYNIAVGAVALSWNYRDTTGALDPTITDSYEGNMAGKEIGFHTTGHYALKAGGTGPYPVTVYRAHSQRMLLYLLHCVRACRTLTVLA